MSKDNNNDIMALTPELLLKAYAVGIFPMAENAQSDDIFWCDPPRRGVMTFDRFHVSKSLRRTIRQKPFDIRINYNFLEVVEGCAQSTPTRPDTWINPLIKKLYLELHEMGHAHSVECRDKENRLVGGLYGVSLGGLFFGESMFSREKDASKVALVHLMARLWAGGYLLLDTQFVTPHLKTLGAYEIPRAHYQSYLSQGLKLERRMPPDFYSAESVSMFGTKGSFFSSEEDLVASFLQSTTQIS